MSEGIITRRIKTPTQFLLDRFRNAAAAYSLRPLTSSGQDNPVVKVRRSVDDTEQDFNPAQINDGTLEQFVNAGDVAPADYGTGAAAAYSLRYVSDGYTGDVIRVRESTNNSEQDFNPTEITDGTLLAFCGSGDGLVTTWYDQSGNSNDATQSTANDQPKIVDAGSLVVENGKPAIDFDGSDDYFENTSIVVNQPSTYFVLYRYDDISDIDNTDLVDGINSRNLIDLGGAKVHRIFAGVSINTTIAGTLNQELSYNLFNGASSEKAINGGTAETGNAGTDALDGLRVAANFSSARLDGTIQELLIYDSDQSSNRELIETNVNHYYSIYSQTNDGFVTTWYDQSGNGNDATQSTAGSQPKIVDAGVLITENGKPAIDFDGSDDFFSASSWGISGTQDRSFFITAKADFTDSSHCYLGIGDGTFQNNSDKWFFTTELGVRVFGGNEIYGSPSTSQALVAHIFSGTNVTDNTAYINGTESVATASSATTISTDDTVNQIASEGTSTSGEDTFNGKYQELLIYNSDQSSNRQQIESNINNHYGIY